LKTKTQENRCVHRFIRYPYQVHKLVQTALHLSMHWLLTGTNAQKCLSAQGKATGCGGRVVGLLPRPTPNGNPSTVGLRHLIHTAIAAWMSPYQGSVSWVRYRFPFRLESAASQLQTTPPAARSLAAWASAGSPTTRPPQIQQRAQTGCQKPTTVGKTGNGKHISYREDKPAKRR
jgi:hypothetical protein